MRIAGSIILIELLILSTSLTAYTQHLSRNDFPPGFIFGVGSAAYQYEGSAAEDGRKPSIFDTFAHIKGNILDEGNKDVAVDQYHRYKEDIDLMSVMGVDAYRLSISWSRLIPDGKGPINPKGLEYYNNLINELLASGYDAGGFPPQRCSQPFGNCTAGNSTFEPYIVGHHVLLSHSAAVELYRKNYQAKQRGWVELVILANWMIPLTNKSIDVVATQRAKDFMLGWFLEPLVFGDYPVGIRNVVGSRLPSFTKEQAQNMQGSMDFIGVNHYFTLYCFDVPRKGAPMSRDYMQDMSIGYAVERDGIPISNQAALEYIKDRFNNPPILVYENGFADPNNSSIPLSEVLDDQYRIDFHLDVLQYMLAAIRNGSDIRGYFIWTLLDDFELLTGYTWSFGLHHVDFNDNLKRYPKLSAHWYKTFLLKRENKRSRHETLSLQNTNTSMNISWD